MYNATPNTALSEYLLNKLISSSLVIVANQSLLYLVKQILHYKKGFKNPNFNGVL